MTQQVCRARILLPLAGPTEDNASFDLTLEATGSDPNLDFGTTETPQAMLVNWINGTIGSHPLAYYLSAQINHAANACSIQWTDITAHLDGTPAGTAFRTDTFTLGTGAGTQGLPGQLSACVGMRRNYGSDLEHGPIASLPTDDSAIDQGAPPTHLGQTRPRARDRGRFYLGPLQVAALNSSGDGTWDPTFTSSVVASLHYLFSTFNNGLANQFNVVQWSRRNASIGQVTFFYLNEGAATVRKRQDTTQARVHTWVAV